MRRNTRTHMQGAREMTMTNVRDIRACVNSPLKKNKTEPASNYSDFQMIEEKKERQIRKKGKSSELPSHKCQLELH